MDALLRESKKEKIEYKLEALKCFGNILETFTLDRFADIFSIVSPVLDMVGQTYQLHSFNPLPDDKILDWSKLKQTAEDIIKFI